ncbi:MAG TPA: CRISPR-associated protein Csx15 [Ktedonobacteraceae bacterium]|nr:CRISPR-associated protein Csx15 [Ktedonobacteraceae bacterium]
MLILNFAHPLTIEQQGQIESLSRSAIEEIRTIKVQIDQERPLMPQIEALLETCGLSPEDWQERSLLINPPGYAPAAFVLLASLHGRIGHFPALIRQRPRGDHPIPSYEVAELLSLQQVRETSRKYR